MKTFDPKNFDVIFAGLLMRGFAEGSKVSVSPESAGFSDKVGVDGETVRERIHDGRYTVTISLMQTSESNADLSNQYNADRQATNGAGVGSLRIVDREGETVFESAKAWIMQEPDLTVEDKASGNDWEVRCADGKMFHGATRDD